MHKNKFSPPFDFFCNHTHGLLLALALAMFIFSSVTMTWNQPLVTTLLLLLALLIQIVFRSGPGDQKVMLVAAILGTPAEIAEVHLGEWTYHAPDLVYGVPIWIPLVWANLFALFVRLVRCWRAILDVSFSGEAIVHRGRVRIVLTVVVMALSLAALLLMQKMALVQGLYLGMVTLMFLFWRTEMDLLLFLTGGALGTLGEFVCVQLGYWHYYNPLFKTYGVDITLPLDWGLSAVIIHRLATLRQKALMP